MSELGLLPPRFHPRYIPFHSPEILRTPTSLIMKMAGWGATDETGEQSQFPRKVDLSFNKTTDCDCREQYILETNVGADNEDPCSGDSG